MWSTGLTWGIRIHKPGPSRDPGSMFHIQRRFMPPTQQEKPIGPLAGLEDPFPDTREVPPASGPISDPKGPSKPFLSMAPSLLPILQDMHHLLNHTQPFLARDCWLCLRARPPYYIGIGSPHQIVSSSTPCFARRPSLSLGSIQENASCIFSSNYDFLNSPYTNTCIPEYTLNVSFPSMHNYQPPNNSWFACTMGLTRCIKFLPNEKTVTPFLCVSVHVLPQVYAYSGVEGGLLLSNSLTELNRAKRAAPLVVPILVGLGLAGTAALSTAL